MSRSEKICAAEISLCRDPSFVASKRFGFYSKDSECLYKSLLCLQKDRKLRKSCDKLVVQNIRDELFYEHKSTFCEKSFGLLFRKSFSVQERNQG